MIIYVVSKAEDLVDFIREDVIKAFTLDEEAQKFVSDKSAESDGCMYFITEVELVLGNKTMLITRDGHYD